MPITPHPSFVQPDDTDILWRYMDLAKFCALLVNSSIWLPTAETLAADDPHEGMLPKGNYLHREWRQISDVPPDALADIHRTTYGQIDSIEYKLAREKQNRDMRIANCALLRKGYFVSSWHHQSYESAAMWKVYGSPGPGIAIMTNMAALRRAFAQNNENMHVGKIKYVDDSTVVDTKNAFNSVLVKRNIFEFENEVRIVYWNTEYADFPYAKFNAETQMFERDDRLDEWLRRPRDTGRAFGVELSALILGIWISPYSPPWYSDVVQKLCTKYCLSVSVKRSALLDIPSP